MDCSLFCAGLVPNLLSTSQAPSGFFVFTGADIRLSSLPWVGGCQFFSSNHAVARTDKKVSGNNERRRIQTTIARDEDRIYLARRLNYFANALFPTIVTYPTENIPTSSSGSKHHIFRKTFATVLIQGGADITAVGDLCRHKSPRTTLQYYAAVNKERSKEVHQRVLNRVLNGRVTPEEFLAGTEQSRPDREAVRIRRRVL